MKKLGTAEWSVFLCNQCGRRISIKGIRISARIQGEYCVSFFTCPHCGRAYHINTTDAKQRGLFKSRDEIGKKISLAVGFRYRQKTLDRYRKEAAKIEKEIKKNAERLTDIGKKILKVDCEAKTGEPEDGDSGAESI